MKGKTRNIFENIGILFFVCCFLYSGYFFIFTSNDEIKIKQNAITVATLDYVEQNSSIQQNTYIKKEKEQGKDKDEVKGKHILKISSKTTSLPIISNTVKKDTNISNPAKEINTNTIISKKEQKQIINLFLKTTKNKINSNIKQLSSIKIKEASGFVKIRITILKDGNFEHIKFINGNFEYFNFIKSAIVKAFPIKIDKKIDDQFPRYFRMEIKYQ